MANEFIARNGLISQNNSVVTGSLTVTQGITGSLFGTASWATNAISVSNITVTNDSSTDTSYYPIFSPLSSGAGGAKVDFNYLTYNPFTKLLTTGDLSLTYPGNRTLTLQATSAGGTEIKLLPNASSGFARINVGNTTQPLDFQMNSVNVMRITQTGNVGIGTTTPSAKLDVSGSVNISGSLLVGTGSILTTSTFFGFTPNLVVGMNTGSSGAVLDLRNTSTSTVVGNTLGTIQFSALGDGTAYPSSQIRSTVNGNVGSGTVGGGNIAIWTALNQTAAVPVERMRVNDRGQVLIGLTSSLDVTSKLIVNGSTTITGSLTSTATTLLNTLSGNTAVGLSTDTTTARLQVRGTGATSDTNTFLVQNSALTNLLRVRDDGTVNIANSALTVSSSGTTFLSNTTNTLDIVSGQATALTVAGGNNGNNIATFKSITTNETLAYISTNGSIFATGSITATRGITGSLFGTSSWAQNATTASYVLQAVSSSFVTTASYAENGGVTQIVAGTNVTISPTNGLGAVTINSTGGGGSGGTDLGLVQAMVVGLQNIF